MIRKDHKWISEIDGRPVTAHDYSFSIEERTHLRKILGKYKEPKVEAFMRLIEIYLDYTHRILDRLNIDDHAAHRDKLFKIRERLEATHKDIMNIRSGRFQTLPARQCSAEHWNDQDIENPRVKIRREIAFATSILATPEYLQKIIENLTLALETEKMKRGEHYKPEFSLASQIAQAFKKYLGMPRPYSGPFPEIIHYCFEILGIKGNDHSRAVHRAIEKLSRP